MNLTNIGISYITPAFAGIASSAVLCAMGHTRLWWQGGLIGFFQGAIAAQLARRLPEGKPPAVYIASQIVMGATLSGLALLAAKVGYLAATITLRSSLAIIATSMAANWVGLILTTAADEAVKSGLKPSQRV